MRKQTIGLTLALAGLLLAAPAPAAEKGKLMHCFTFTAVETATQADWDAFFKATDALPGKIPGLESVWYGKLRSPQTLFNVDANTRKEIAAGTAPTKPEITRVVRQWGVCMEMKDEAVLKTYATSPAHKEWEAAYSKVRVYGTTTFDIMAK